LSEEKDELIIEEAEEPETTLTTEEVSEDIEDLIELENEDSEEIDEEPVEAKTETEEPAEEDTEESEKDVSEEPEEELSVESVEEAEPEADEVEVEEAESEELEDETLEEEFEIPDVPLEAETDEDLAIPDIPLDDETLIEADDLEIPDVPLEVDSKEDDSEVEFVEEISAKKADDVDADVAGFEPKKVKSKKKKKKKARKPRGKAFALSTLVGLFLALLIIALFSIPLWLGGTGRPDLYYIELVLMLIVMMIPGLFTRSVQKGILGAFIIFIISFAIPVVFTIFGLDILLSPLTPIFSSTDFSLDAFAIFSSLFSALDGIPIATVQTWIWVVDLLVMFLLTLITVAIGTWLVKNITRPKKKAKNWIAIPLLSLGMIIFVVFTPIIFSSTYGLIQASTSFLAGTTHMQDAYNVFEITGGSLPTTQQQSYISENLTQASYWLNISSANFQGLQNIGFNRIASLLSPQYGPLIAAGDQMALAMLGLTGVLFPLFNGIFELTQSLTNATDDMANFGQSSSTSLMLADTPSEMTISAIGDIDALKESIQAAIIGLDSAEAALLEVQSKLTDGDLVGAFAGVKESLDDLIISGYPDDVANLITEIINNIDSFDDQLTGFESFVEFATVNIAPTRNILWTTYYSIVGNEYLRNNRFAEAKIAFQLAINNITAIDLSTYTPDSALSGIFSMDITDDFAYFLNDLVAMMTPLLHEEFAFAATYERIDYVMSNFALETDLTFVNYTDAVAPIPEGLDAETFGIEAQVELDAFRTNLTDGYYGTAFGEIGKNLNNSLTSDFKPAEYGLLTKYTSEMFDQFIIGCQAYATQDFGGSTTGLITAENILNTDILPILTIDDPAYLKNYFGNWSIAITSIRSSMETNNTIGDHATGLSEIQLIIQSLYIDIEEK